MDRTEFSGRVALVTGAAGDIGAATAAAFAARGAHLVVTDRRAEPLETVADALREAGGEVLAHACDQSEPEAVDGLFRTIHERFGRLDTVFINAGYGRYGALIDLPFEQWRRHVDVNLNGGFLISQGAARVMAAGGRGGAMVFNASTAAEYVCDLLGAYAASKAGVRLLAKSLASELGAHRIRVNLILPGVVETAMTSSLLDEAGVQDDVLRNTPVGRLGRPEDIAQAVIFLSSDASAYTTGAELLVDGGQTLHGYPRWFSADYRQTGGEFRPHNR